MDESPGEVDLPQDAVGIVVQDGGPLEARPRAVVFVWGGKVRPRPSLPFGRWKNVVPAL
jgi:hypothetical protein